MPAGCAGPGKLSCAPKHARSRALPPPTHGPSKPESESHLLAVQVTLLNADNGVRFRRVDRSLIAGKIIFHCSCNLQAIAAVLALDWQSLAVPDC